MPQNTINHITPSNFELLKVNSELNWLNITVILFCILLIIISKSISSKSIASIISLNKNNPLQPKGTITYLLSLNYFIVVTLYIWNYYALTSIDFNYNSFFIILISVIGISLLKLTVIYLIDILFKRNNHFHITLHIQFYKLQGIILLLLYILTYFFDNQTLTTTYLFILIFTIILIIIREIKSLFTALNNRISLLYLILYLCTLELLPIALIIKFFLY